MLDTVAQSSNPLSLREIAERTGFNKSTVYRILSSLLKANYLQQNSATGEYSISPSVLQLTEGYFRQVNLVDKARPILQRLVDQYNETAGLSVQSGIHRVLVLQIESSQELRRVVRVGAPLSLHAGSASKVLLAFLPDEERDRIIDQLHFEQLTRHTPPDRETLCRQLEEVWQAGCAISQEERIEGGAGVAAPVFDRNGRVAAAITINVPSVRFGYQRGTVLVEAVKKAAAELSRHLGYLSSSKENQAEELSNLDIGSKGSTDMAG